MAVSPCMTCLKSCGYLCGLLAGLNIWFWIGMTVFNAMGNPWIAKEILKEETYTGDFKKFTTVFGICIFVSVVFPLSTFIFQLNILCLIGCCWCTTCPCYQDKDQIVYFAGANGSNKVGGYDSGSSKLGGFNVRSVNADYNQMRPNLNGSGDSDSLKKNFNATDAA